MKNIQINNKFYICIDKFCVNLSDSFVSPNNKIGSGNGEARLYIESQNSTPFFKFSSTEFVKNRGNTYPICTSTCYLLKENLINYLNSTYNYYLNPTQNHNRNILNFFNERERMVNNQEDLIPFNIYMQNGQLDSYRFYIGSASFPWHNIIRELAIPKYSYLNIYKLIDSNNEFDIIYVFELYFNESNTPSNINTLENNIIQSIINNVSIDSTERISLLTSRNGQGKFRSNVLNIMPVCPFTGISDSFLLRASHIIPWRMCRNNNERLDGFNGLALTPSYDVLFDKGLISFENNGSLIISSKLSYQIIESLNLIQGKIYNIENLNGNKNIYLEFHRYNIFKL